DSADQNCRSDRISRQSTRLGRKSDCLSPFSKCGPCLLERVKKYPVGHGENPPTRSGRCAQRQSGPSGASSAPPAPDRQEGFPQKLKCGPFRRSGGIGCQQLGRNLLKSMTWKRAQSSGLAITPMLATSVLTMSPAAASEKLVELAEDPANWLMTGRDYNAQYYSELT